MVYFYRNLFLIFALILMGTGCGSSATRKTLDKVQVLFEVHEYMKALGLIQEQIRLHPKEQKLQEAFIAILLCMDRVDLARSEYKTFIRNFPRNSFLINALSHKEANVRKGAAQLAGLQGDAAAFSLLAKLLKDPEVEVRRAAISALGNLHATQSIKALRQALQDSSWFVRADAADALRKLSDRGAIPNLLLALQDEEAYVRHMASRAIQDLVDSSYEKTMIEALQDKNKDVHHIAVKLIFQIIILQTY